MSYLFKNEDIAASVNELSEYYKKNKIDRKISLQNTLSLEEILLQYRDRFGENAEYSLDISRKHGVHHARLEVNGEMFNPMDDSIDESEQYTQNLLKGMGVVPSYNYRRKTNIIDIKTDKAKMSPILVLILTLGLSIVLGLFVKNFVPTNVAKIITDEIFRPLSNSFASFISAIVGPVVFFTIIVATINVGDLSSLKKLGNAVLGNLFLFSSLFYILGISIPVVLAGIDKGGMTESPLRIIRDTILSIIPGNIVTSFSENSILQLMFWGIIIALTILAIGKQNSGIAEGLVSLREVFNHIMSFVGSILPFYLFMSIFLMIYDEFEVILRGGVVFIYYFTGIAVCFLLAIASTYIFAKVSPKKLLKIAFPTSLASSMACSSLISLGATIKNLSDKSKFAVDKKTANFITPVSQTLFKPFTGINYFTLTLGIIQLSGTPLSLSNLIILILLCMVFAIASPPCACGGMAVYTVLFQVFHIDVSYLAFVVALDTLVDYFTSGFTALGNYVCVLIIDARMKK